MPENQDRLFELLPKVYRQRDAKQGWPLRALLQVISEQVDIVEDDIQQLYENWFIETCEDWVVPYIADLVGYEPIHEGGQVGDSGSGKSQLRNKILVPRQEVAHTIRNRRRKGTLALLELLAMDVARWPSRAVEFYQNLVLTQHLNHLRVDPRRSSISLRRGDVLDRINGPFDGSGHSVDIRRANSIRTQGKYNIPNVGLFVWRLSAYSVTRSKAYHFDSTPYRYTFSILKHNCPLYIRPTPEEDLVHIATEYNLPVPLKRRVFKENINQFYGEDKSLQLWIGMNEPQWPVPIEQIVAANLSDKENVPPAGKIAVDPELGRISFAAGEGPGKNEDQIDYNVWVYYNYGFPADIGGGEYSRKIIQISPYDLGDKTFDPADIVQPNELAQELFQGNDPKIVYLRQQLEKSIELPDPADELTAEQIAGFLNILADGPNLSELELYQDLVQLPDEVKSMLQRNPDAQLLRYINRLVLEKLLSPMLRMHYRFYKVGYNQDFNNITAAYNQWRIDQPHYGIIEIADSREYTEKLELRLSEYQNLQIRAANRKRPVVRILDKEAGRIDAWIVKGAENSRVTLDGLCFWGRGVHVNGPLGTLTIRHCTLVPGWEIDLDGEPDQPTEHSLFLAQTNARVNISHSIIGSIQTDLDEILEDPLHISISDSILDATMPEEEAIGSFRGEFAFANLSVVRSTVMGLINTHEISLIENSILYSIMRVARRQKGCIRYSYIDPSLETRTPRRFNCQPDLVMKLVSTDVEKDAEAKRVRPRFNSVRFGTANYFKLANSTADEIKRGADDESEMGVYHDLFLPQRETNLRIRLNEYTPAGKNAGIFFVT